MPDGDPKPSSKVQVDANFEGQVKKLIEANKKIADNLKLNQAAGWMMPDMKDWDGDLFNNTGISGAFDRKDLNDACVSAIENASSPGVVGDIISGAAQVEYLAIFERAFRARHTMRRPRALAHAISRHAGHGHPAGVIGQTVLEYVRGLTALSKV